MSAACKPWGAPLHETVPIGNAAMDDRTFIEWDKDDIDMLGLMKVDVLALGMLSCLRRGLDLLQQHYGKSYSPATLPQDDPAVSMMLARADPGRRVPGRKPRADVDVVAIKAALLLRPGHRSGDRAPGADPGRHGASLSAPARQHRPGTLHLARSGAWTGERAGRRAQAHARRAVVSGTGDADHEIRRPNLRPTRPTGCAAPWRPSAIPATCICSARGSSTA